MYKAAAVILIVLAMMATLSGCAKEKDKIISEFGELIGKGANSESINETAEFLDKNIKKLDEEDASKLLVNYRKYLFEYIAQNKDKTVTQELVVYIDQKTGRIDKEKIENSEHKSYYDRIKAGSLMVIMGENLPVLRIDHYSLLDRYGEYVSDSINELYLLEALMTEEPATENATLTIGFDELLSRAYRAEKLIKKYGEDENIIDDAMWVYTSYLNTILMGTTNSPMFNKETKKFRESAREEYKKFIVEEPDSTLTWVLKEYFTYLNGIGYTLDFNDINLSKVFFDTCDWLVSEGTKRVNEK